MEYYQVSGEEVHEVAVGPVHAGIIEPGHFRFQCHGEEVFHLEISLGYQHRGIEAALLKVEGTQPHYQIIVDRKKALDDIEITVETDKDIRSREYIIVLTARVGLQVDDTDATVRVDRI